MWQMEDQSVENKVGHWPLTNLLKIMCIYMMRNMNKYSGSLFVTTNLKVIPFQKVNFSYLNLIM